MSRKIVLIDGYSLLFRAFHALPLMDNGEGVYTNAVYGFMSMLLKVVSSEKPDALAVAFDVDKHTFRHEKYDAYKAGRAPTPEEMKGQVDAVKEILRLSGIAVLQKQGYEADDVLGTVSRICEENKDYAVIVTGDRDSYQLAGEYTSILYTKKGISETEMVTPEWINEKYGLAPRQLIDVKALMGDASDNIPGVKGVGEKTAVKLIADYGDLENALSHAETDQKGALREKLLSGVESARFSRFLAEIERHVPIDFDFDACRVTSFAGAVPYLRTLKLRKIVEMIGSAAPEEAPVPAEVRTKADWEYKTVSREELPGEIGKIASSGEAVSVFVSDCLSVAAGNICFSVPLGGDLLTPGLDESDICALCAPLEKNEKVLLHNAKDFMWPAIRSSAKVEDTMLAAYVINPQSDSRNINDLCAAYDISVKPGFEAAAVWDAWNKLSERLAKDGLTSLYRDVELPLMYVLSDMEQAGIRVDPEYLKTLGKLYDERISRVTKEIYALAGKELNLNSPKQLKALLFDEMKLPVPGGKKTAGTGAEILEELADDYPICGLILEYRKYQKLQSTYVTGLLSSISEDGRIRTRFEQAVTGTGRISSREPNLQNIPVRTEEGREIRRAFIPAEGHVFVDADYSQIELRVLAHMSGDANMQDAFLKNEDIHRRTASEIFKVPLSLVTPTLRSRAKAVNFGVVYGISQYGLSKNTGVSVGEAAGFIEAYFDRYPDIKKFMDEQVALGKTQGYVTTMLGRRRYLPELTAQAYTMRQFGERAAMNSPIQGSAADIIKLAMVRVSAELKKRGMKTRLLMQVHDELILEAPQNEADEACKLLTSCMESVVSLSVPLVSEVAIGGNWNECKP